MTDMITLPRAEVQQALEALKKCSDWPGAYDECNEVVSNLSERLAREDNGGKTGWAPGMLQDDDSKLSKWLANRPGARRDAMAAREEQEPVAWEQFYPDMGKPQPAKFSCGVDVDGDVLSVSVVKKAQDGALEVIHSEQISLLPQPAIVTRAEEAFEAAQERGWVGLTKDEVDALWDETVRGYKSLPWVIRAVEAKLREKNA